MKSPTAPPAGLIPVFRRNKKGQEVSVVSRPYPSRWLRELHHLQPQGQGELCPSPPFVNCTGWAPVLLRLDLEDMAGKGCDEPADWSANRRARSADKRRRLDYGFRNTTRYGPPHQGRQREKQETLDNRRACGLRSPRRTARTLRNIAHRCVGRAVCVVRWHCRRLQGRPDGRGYGAACTRTTHRPIGVKAGDTNRGAW